MSTVLDHVQAIIARMAGEEDAQPHVYVTFDAETGRHAATGPFPDRATAQRALDDFLAQYNVPAINDGVDLTGFVAVLEPHHGGTR